MRTKTREQSRSLNILYLCQYFTPPDAPGGSRAYEMARRMVREGHQVRVITSSAFFGHSREFDRLFNQFELEGIRVEAVRVSYSNYMSISARILSFLIFAVLSSARSILGPRPDVVFASSTPLTIALPGLIARFRFRVPLVFEVRDLVLDAAIEAGHFKSRVLRVVMTSFEQFVYRTSERIVALSPSMSEAITERGIRKAKISVVPNCCDTKVFGLRNRKRARARLGLSDSFLCLYAGSLGPIYGTRYLVDVAKEMRANGSQAHLLLLGDGAERPYIEQRIRDLKLENIQVWHPVPRLEMADWYAACDLGLVVARDLSVLSTCSPNKFFDLLAAGRPIVMTYGGWMADLLRQHDAGINVPAERPAQLAEAIQSLERDPGRVQQLGANARSLGIRQFDRDRLASKLIAVLEKAANSRRRNDHFG